jgi:hypothetical protein
MLVQGRRGGKIELGGRAGREVVLSTFDKGQNGILLLHYMPRGMHAHHSLTHSQPACNVYGHEREQKEG